MIGDYVAWLVWCPNCRDVHHISHLRNGDHGQTDSQQAWQRLVDKLITWGIH